jgi:peptide/nickel transport system substrate-binding protein
MTLRDRGLIAALAIALIALSGVTLASSYVPTVDNGSQPSEQPHSRPYVEGVIGHATNASPFGARSPADKDLVALLFRGLVRLGPGNTLVPDLASSWEVDPTGSEWTFHLRPNLAWDDGAPLTSDDVVFTVDALSDPDYTGPGAASWRSVTATASDPLTVTLYLSTPLGGFLEAATQAIAPAHLLGQVAPADLPNDPFGHSPIGSGPFRLTSLDSSRAMLEAVAGTQTPPDDAGPNLVTPPPTDSLGSPPRTPPPDTAVPYLSGIELLFYDDVSGLETAWQRGILDAASGVSPGEATTLAASGGAQVLRYPSTTLLAVDLDLRPARVEFLDAAVRKALLEAIPRDAIVAGVLDGLGVRADSLVPPTSAMFSASAVKVLPYSQAAARSALTANGWKPSGNTWIPKGSKTPLTIEVLSPEETANPVAYATAQIVVSAWQAIGLDVKLTPLPAAELLGNRLHPGGFQAAVLPLAIGLDPDIYPLLASTQSRSDGSNASGLQDPSLDRLLEAARAPGSEAARAAAYAALETRLGTGCYILPLAFRDEYVVLRNTVTGPTSRPISSSGDRFWDVLTWRLADGR